MIPISISDAEIDAILMSISALSKQDSTFTCRLNAEPSFWAKPLFKDALVSVVLEAEYGEDVAVSYDYEGLRRQIRFFADKDQLKSWLKKGQTKAQKCGVNLIPQPSELLKNVMWKRKWS